MFSLEEKAFGPFKLLHIVESHSGVGMEVLPDYGGILQSLTLANQVVKEQVLQSYASGSRAYSTWRYYGALLAPFPNRVDHGRYTWQGKAYTLVASPEADPVNALHGLVWQRPFAVESVSLSDSEARVVLVHKYAGLDKGYPFPFSVSVIYTLHIAEGLRVELRVENMADREIPMGLGWHPYFRLGNDPVDQLKLRVPESYKLLTEGGIPNGQTQLYRDHTESRLVGNTEFDDCFQLAAKGTYAVELERASRNFGVRLTHQLIGDKVGYLQLYTPPERNSIALEPMSCAPDAFNNHKGLTILRPGESTSLHCSVAAI